MPRLPPTTVLHLRLDRRQLAALSRAAGAAGRPLAEWARAVLLEAAGLDPGAARRPLGRPRRPALP